MKIAARIVLLVLLAVPVSWLLSPSGQAPNPFQRELLVAYHRTGGSFFGASEILNIYSDGSVFYALDLTLVAEPTIVSKVVPLQVMREFVQELHGLGAKDEQDDVPPQTEPVRTLTLLDPRVDSRAHTFSWAGLSGPFPITLLINDFINEHVTN